MYTASAPASIARIPVRKSAAGERSSTLRMPAGDAEDSLHEEAQSASQPKGISRAVAGCSMSSPRLGAFQKPQKNLQCAFSFCTVDLEWIARNYRSTGLGGICASMCFSAPSYRNKKDSNPWQNCCPFVLIDYLLALKLLHLVRGCILELSERRLFVRFASTRHIPLGGQSLRLQEEYLVFIHRSRSIGQRLV